MLFRIVFVALLGVVQTSIALAQNGDDLMPPPSDPPAMNDATVEDAAALAARNRDLLWRTFEQHYNWEMYEFPEEAMSRGNYSQAHRITDRSLEAYGQRNKNRQRFLKILERIDRAALSSEDQLNFDLFKLNLQRDIDSHSFSMFLAPISGRSGPQTDIPELAERVRFDSETDYENYLTRLELTAQSIQHFIALMKLGLERGITPPRITLAGVPAQFDAILNGGLAPLAKPFDSLPAHIAAPTAELLRQRFEKESLPALEAGMRDFHKFFVEEYLPNTRESIAATSLPNGDAYYAHQLRVMTTTEYSPQEIHDIGLEEVARIRAEMMTVIRKSDFMQLQPDVASLDDQQLFRAFIEYLRTDERFYCKSPEELLDRYRAICKEADPWLARLFGFLPRLPYGVKAIPDFIAPHTTTAYYQSGDMRNAEPGWFYANTYALDQRPTYEMIPLALHEAVPGHHLQIAIAKELDGLPEFRKEAWFTAYGEGWALYAERLGIEMGMYEDPYDDFGRLLYEMWRATRLVVDPGMHALGWSREQAIQFMLDNTALSEHNITTEVDRYIAWPGQACGYKIGEIVIRNLRADAEKQLDEKFDIRAFHDVVLGAGAIPLTVLESRVKDWISAQIDH